MQPSCFCHGCHPCDVTHMHTCTRAAAIRASRCINSNYDVRISASCVTYTTPAGCGAAGCGAAPCGGAVATPSGRSTRWMVCPSRTPRSDRRSPSCRARPPNSSRCRSRSTPVTSTRRSFSSKTGNWIQEWQRTLRPCWKDAHHSRMQVCRESTVQKRAHVGSELQLVYGWPKRLHFDFHAARRGGRRSLHCCGAVIQCKAIGQQCEQAESSSGVKQGKVVKLRQRGPECKPCAARPSGAESHVAPVKTLQNRNSNRHSGGVAVLQVLGVEATI